jgi:hypothetical protein
MHNSQPHVSIPNYNCRADFFAFIYCQAFLQMCHLYMKVLGDNPTELSYYRPFNDTQHNDIQHSNTQYKECICALSIRCVYIHSVHKWHSLSMTPSITMLRTRYYVESVCAECCILFFSVLNVIMLCFIKLNVLCWVSWHQYCCLQKKLSIPFSFATA